MVRLYHTTHKQKNVSIYPLSKNGAKFVTPTFVKHMFKKRNKNREHMFKTESCTLPNTAMPCKMNLQFNFKSQLKPKQ